MHFYHCTNKGVEQLKHLQRPKGSGFNKGEIQKVNGDHPVKEGMLNTL